MRHETLTKKIEAMQFQGIKYQLPEGTILSIVDGQLTCNPPRLFANSLLHFMQYHNDWSELEPFTLDQEFLNRLENHIGKQISVSSCIDDDDQKGTLVIDLCGIIEAIQLKLPSRLFDIVPAWDEPGEEIRFEISRKVKR